MLFRKKAKEVTKIGIAFGGGGARGLAHIGAIKAFEENGINFDVVAGTSVGSLIGAFYAEGFTSKEMLDIANSVKVKDIRTSKIFFMPSKTDGIENLIIKYLGDKKIEDLKKPFTAVAVDMITGTEIHISKGNLSKAIAGSCSVPGFFNYVDFEKYRLHDGGLQNTIPADVLRNDGCKYVISIDVNPTRGSGTDSTKLLDMISASIGIMMKSNAVKGKLFSDITIEPNLQKFKSTSLEGADEMVQIGYEATMAVMPQIKLLLGLETIGIKPRRFRDLFKFNKKKLLKESKETTIQEKIK